MHPLAEKCRELRDNIIRSNINGENVSITLNGKPASICGFVKKFGRVWQLDNYAISAEYSWDTIYRVLTENGGKFNG